MNNSVVGIYLGNHPFGTKYGWENVKTGGVGGSELWGLKLSEGLSNLGHTVVLFIDTNRIECINCFVSYHAAPMCQS